LICLARERLFDVYTCVADVAEATARFLLEVSLDRKNSALADGNNPLLLAFTDTTGKTDI